MLKVPRDRSRAVADSARRCRAPPLVVYFSLWSVGLEAAGGFGLPQSVEATYARLIGSLDIAFATWASQ